MNMQMIYFHMFGGEMNTGVNKKIFAQASNLHTLGVDIRLVLLGGLNTDYPENVYTQLLPCNSYFFKSTLLKRLHRQYLAKQYCKNVITSSDTSTILYLRYPIPILMMPHDLLSQRKCKIVFECNSIEINEEKRSRSYFSYFWEIIFGKGFRKHCDAIIGVTDEITHYQLSRSGNLNKPHLTLGNGFDVDSVPLRQPPPYNGSNLNILCVATVSFWHGIDRVIKGIAQYKGPVNIQLHIVGIGAELGNLKNLICSLIHRKGLTMTSELKSREYCARGIPFIIACSDRDFPGDFSYILRLPADESPIDMEPVIIFTSRIYLDSDHSQKMNQYARKNLDWSVKMKKMRTFLKDLVNETR
jgi:glycosyltransferase involved in cell wall biosynthesis